MSYFSSMFLFINFNSSLNITNNKKRRLIVQYCRGNMHLELVGISAKVKIFYCISNQHEEYEYKMFLIVI